MARINTLQHIPLPFVPVVAFASTMAVLGIVLGGAYVAVAPGSSSQPSVKSSTTAGQTTIRVKPGGSYASKNVGTLLQGQQHTGDRSKTNLQQPTTSKSLQNAEGSGFQASKNTQ